MYELFNQHYCKSKWCENNLASNVRATIMPSFLFHITDVSPPTFGVTCPAIPLQVFAERGLFSAQVSWNEPVATDNSGVPPTVTLNYQPPQRFSQGTHVIMYTAEDQSANKATCSFSIQVIGNAMFSANNFVYWTVVSFHEGLGLLLRQFSPKCFVSHKKRHNHIIKTLLPVRIK